MKQYRSPGSVVESFELVTRLSAKMLNRPLGFKESVAARKCLATISRVKVIAVIVSDAYPSLWNTTRAGADDRCPDGPGMVLWIHARAVRDFKILIANKLPATQVDEIRERQNTALSVLKALDPGITITATMIANSDEGSQVDTTADPGQSLVPASPAPRARLETPSVH